MNAKIRSTATLADIPLPEGFQAGTYAYKVQLRYQGRTITVPFFMGPGLCREPTTEDVLECLCSDATGYDNAQGFEDWCSEYGYDTDSRKAEATYKAVAKQTEKLKRLLGEDYEAIVFSDHEKLGALCD